MGSVCFGQRVRILPTAPYFSGSVARVAYIGSNGVSVYLEDSDFDECIPLKHSEYEVIKTDGK